MRPGIIGRPTDPQIRRRRRLRAARQHFLKLEQLQRLREAHVPVPRTLASNDPQAVLAFAGDLGGPMVYKPLAGGGLCRRAGTEDLRAERLAALERRTGAAPVTTAVAALLRRGA